MCPGSIDGPKCAKVVGGPLGLNYVVGGPLGFDTRRTHGCHYCVVWWCGGEGAFKIWSGGLVGQNPCDGLPCLGRLPRFVVKFDSDTFLTWFVAKHLPFAKKEVTHVRLDPISGCGAQVCDSCW